MTSGITAIPSESSSSVASSTAVIGSRSMVAVIAPMPMAMAATSGRPGKYDSTAPATAPMKIAGNIGPPRKLLSEKL